MLPQGIEAVTGDDAADESASELLEAISFITTFLLIFAGIALVVGSFLIVNTFSILVAQRSRELALLRALGASQRQVMWSVQLEAFVLGLLGSDPGSRPGCPAGDVLLRLLFGKFGLDLSGQSLVFAPRTFIAAYVVGVLVTMAAALAAGAAHRPDRAGAGAAATTSRCRRPRCADGSATVWPCWLPGCSRSGWGSAWWSTCPSPDG